MAHAFIVESLLEHKEVGFKTSILFSDHDPHSPAILGLWFKFISNIV